MYYGTGAIDVHRRADEILQDSCYSYALDKCLFPEDWDPNDPSGAALKPHPECSTLLAARAADPAGFDQKVKALPYCEESSVGPSQAGMVGLVAGALVAGLLVGAIWM